MPYPPKSRVIVAKPDKQYNSGWNLNNFIEPLSSSYRRWALNYNGTSLKYRYYNGTTNQSDTILSLAAETWYEAELRSGADGVLTAAVWQRGNPTVRADRVLGLAASDWATGSGRMYTFSASASSGVLSLDRVEERAVVESGQRTKMANGASSSVWSHDARGQVTQEVKTIAEEGSYTTQWTYNDAGLVSGMEYPDGEVVSTDYLPQLVVDSLSGTETYVSGTQYDAEGRVTQRGLGNGLTSVYEYYEWTLDTNQPGYQQGGRLSTLVTGAFQNLAYRYDPGGNITRIVDSAATPVETLEYSYDLIDRLVSDTTNGGNTYGYDDDEGNLEQKGTSTLVYADPSNHRVTQMGSNTYGYDLNGNMIARSGATLSYDAENRLVEYSGGGVSAAFLYDGDGRRVKGVVNTVTTLYVNDFYEIEGSTVRKYYSAGGQRIAVRENGALSFLLTDHLGSTTVTVDSVTLAKTGELRYSSWGETRYSEGTTPTSRRYTGQYEEASLGLLFFNARWIDPQLGRFVSADSIVPEPGNPGDWDRYAFVLNNPIKNLDPTGHECMVYDGSDCVVNDDGSYINRNDPPILPPENSPERSSSNPTQQPYETYSKACIDYSPCWSKGELPRWWNTNPESPDYYVLSISYGGGIGITGMLIADRYGNVYIAGGGNIGKSISPVTVSFNGGYIASAVDDNIPDQANINTFLTGLAINAQAGVVGNGAFTWSPGANNYISHTATEYGAVIPYVIGISATFGVQLLDPMKLIRR